MTISLPELLSILGLSLTISGIFGTVLSVLWRKVMSNSTEVAVVHQKLSDDLSSHKLQVAERYVSSTRLADMEQKMLLSEERLISSMGNLASRIDRMLERVGKT